MKYSLSKIAGTLCVLSMLLSFQVNALGPIVNGFLIDAAVINYMFHNGAKNIKVYAAMGTDGTYNYVVVPADDAFRTISGQVYRQSSSGVCPPSCEFPPSGLSGNGEYTNNTAGQSLIESYMAANNGVINCVKLSKTTLDRITPDYPYVKVVFSSAVSVNGVNEDGSNAKRVYTDSYNTSCVCGM